MNAQLPGTLAQTLFFADSVRPVVFFALALASGWPLAAVRAQSGPATPRPATVLDLTGASGPTLHYGSAAAWRLWGLDAAGRFQAGVGVRASHFFADSYALGTQAEPNQAGVQVARPRLTSFNAAFHLRARVAGPVRLGFNLDAVGLTVGPDRTTGNPAQDLHPVRGNLLLGGRRDRGSLNSELYAAVALPRGLSLRAGYSHLVTAYETDADRYHRFHNLAALGLSYQLP